MSDLEFEVGDIIKTKYGNLAYLQHKSEKGSGFGVTFSKVGTPWDMIGGINKYCLGDGFVYAEDLGDCKLIDEDDYKLKYEESKKE